MFRFAVVSLTVALLPYTGAVLQPDKLGSHQVSLKDNAGLARRLGELLNKGEIHNSKSRRMSFELTPTKSKQDAADLVKQGARVSNRSFTRALDTFVNGKDFNPNQNKLLRQNGARFDFVTNVVAPVQLEKVLNRESSGELAPHRKLQPTCAVIDDGSIACALLDFPRAGLITIFLDCSEDDTVFNCGSCGIIEEDNLADIDSLDAQCNSCSTCGDTLSFDCSNVDPGVACAAQDCNGNCLGAPTPAPPTSTPPPTPTPARGGPTGLFPIGGGQSSAASPISKGAILSALAAVCAVVVSF